MRRARLLLLIAVAVGAGACGNGAAGGQRGGGNSSTPSSVVGSTTRAPLPAGATPSVISKMVCDPRAQQEIDKVIENNGKGPPAKVSTPTWVGHVYSCNYTYPNGYFTLSVKELSSWSQTYAYFDSLGKSSSGTQDLGNLGQGAFQLKNGNVVVRKDWKVLYVDISHLPAQFGEPPTSRADIAFTVADLILGCWAGD
jgi:hypothetical protein